jgi:hypothetical protein
MGATEGEGMSGDFGRHRLIYSVELLDANFQELDNDHRAVWLYCKVSPQSTSIGLYRLSTALAVEDLHNITASEFDARLITVCDLYGWRIDGVTRVLWIPDWLEKNPPQSPNVVTSWVKLLSNVPDCDLKFEAIAAMGEYLKGFKPSFREPFESYRQRLSKSSRRPQSQPKPQALSDQGSGIRDPRSGNRGTGARRANGSERNETKTDNRVVDERLMLIAHETLQLVHQDATNDTKVDTLQNIARTKQMDVRRADALMALTQAQSERRPA